MAGLEPLQQLIYYEKHQEGSIFCAQHALNALLQGNYFTASDLSTIARSLDTSEQPYHNDNRGANTNMDDTGFFSVQVLENALEEWGLNLQRWRSEAMRPYHDHPHTQLGFILNLDQHWFTLRRFGAVSPNSDIDSDQGHWFNLNSSLDVPEWVDKSHLPTVIQQAEEEGYSVFVVTQPDPNVPLAFPRTEADELAVRLPEPTSALLPSRPRVSGETSRNTLPPTPPQSPSKVRVPSSSSTFTLPFESTISLSLRTEETARSSHSYLQSEGLANKKSKVKTRPKNENLTSVLEKKGFLAKFGRKKDDREGDKEDEETEAPKGSGHSWFSRLGKKKTTENLDQLFWADGVKVGPIQWEKFLKAMGKSGFSYKQASGSRVKFEHPGCGAITIPRPHPESILAPHVLKKIGKKLNKHYGLSEDDFHKALDD